MEQFKRAVEIDDRLRRGARTIRNRVQRRQGSLVLGNRSTQRGRYELRERATDEEKFLITATYHRQVTGNLELALQAFDLWAANLSPHIQLCRAWPRVSSSKGQGRYEELHRTRRESGGCGSRRRPSAISMPRLATCISIGSTKQRKRSRAGRGPEGLGARVFSDGILTWRF